MQESQTSHNNPAVSGEDEELREFVEQYVWQGGLSDRQNQKNIRDVIKLIKAYGIDQRIEELNYLNMNMYHYIDERYYLKDGKPQSIGYHDAVPERVFNERLVKLEAQKEGLQQ